MAFTTYSAFVTALAGVSITGVNKAYTSPPRTIAAADFPLSYPRVPSQRREAVTMTSVAGLKRGTAELVIIMESPSLNTRSVTFAEILALIDAIDSALEDAAADLGADTWQVDRLDESVGEQVYWGLLVTVEASG